MSSTEAPSAPVAAPAPPRPRDTIAGLDRVDTAILRALQANARISNLELAEVVNRSPSAVSERVKRLSREGYITGFRVRIDPDKVGAGQTVFVKVTLSRAQHDLVHGVREAIARQPEVVDCYMMAGEFDFLLKLRVPDMGACQQIVEGIFRGMPGVREIRTYAVMKQLKDSDWLPI